MIKVYYYLILQQVIHHTIVIFLLIDGCSVLGVNFWYMNILVRIYGNSVEISIYSKKL